MNDHEVPSFRNEYFIIQASTNVANMCVKMLEKSLLTEVSRRKDIMLRSELDESTQNKKVVT